MPRYFPGSHYEYANLGLACLDMFCRSGQVAAMRSWSHCAFHLQAVGANRYAHHALFGDAGAARARPRHVAAGCAGLGSADAGRRRSTALDGNRYDALPRRLSGQAENRSGGCHREPGLAAPADRHKGDVRRCGLVCRDCAGRRTRRERWRDRRLYELCRLLDADRNSRRPAVQHPKSDHDAEARVDIFSTRIFRCRHCTGRSRSIPEN